MFDFSRIQNYYIQTGYTDMRMQIDGLVAKVQLEHSRQMEETSIYLFCGRKSDRIKAVYWDGTGYILLYRFIYRLLRYRSLKLRKKSEVFRLYIEGLVENGTSPPICPPDLST